MFMHGMNNEDLKIKRIIDYDGNLRVNLIRNQVIIAKQNQFFFDDWCFPNQTPQELIYYLWNYGKVLYLELGGDLYFFPFDSSIHYLTKSNVHLATITIKDHFNKRLVTKEIVSKAIKKSFPFIFFNSLQTAPAVTQNILFEELSKVYNTNSANKKNKGKSMIVFIPKGAKYHEAIYKHITDPDASPFWYIQYDKDNKNSNLSATNFNQMSSSAPDLYNSLSTEEFNIRKDINTANGLPSNDTYMKGSAQETDSQTNTSKIEMAFVLKHELFELKRGLTGLRSNFPNKKISVKLLADIFNYISSVLQTVKENDDIKPEVKPIEKIANENKKSLFQKIMGKKGKK